MALAFPSGFSTVYKIPSVNLIRKGFGIIRDVFVVTKRTGLYILQEEMPIFLFLVRYVLENTCL